MMTKVGILLHCRHLETIAWEDLVFGLPAEDKLGDHGMLARILLTLSEGEEVVSILIGRGPSYRDGLDEGAYSKQYLIDHFDRLWEFPSLKPLLEKAGDAKVAALKQSIENIVVMPEIKNTKAELEMGAKMFREQGVEKVIQLCAASHASRCIKEQAVARANGVIGKDQLWSTIASDMSYHDTKPEDVCIIEPLHRRDQPMTFVRPGLSEVMIPYFFLPDEDKKAFVTLVEDFMNSKNPLS
jgi:hypothetical protein